MLKLVFIYMILLAAFLAFEAGKAARFSIWDEDLGVNSHTTFRVPAESSLNNEPERGEPVVAEYFCNGEQLLLPDNGMGERRISDVLSSRTYSDSRMSEALEGENFLRFLSDRHVHGFYIYSLRKLII